MRGRLAAYVWPGVLILFAAFALRLANLGTQSLWHDEGWSVFPAYTLIGPMGIRGMDVNAPPLYNITIGLWLRVAGDAVWTMRFWPLLTGLVVVAVGVLVARRWFGPAAGLLAGVFLTFSPILWVFSQEIRGYIPMPLYAVLLLALADPLLNRQRVRHEVWLALAVVELAALYTQNLSVPLVAWLNVAVIAALGLARNWRRLGAWLVMQAALFALYLPWLLTQRQTGTPLNTPPTVQPSLLWQIWQSYFTGIKAMLDTDTALTGLIVAFAALSVVGILAALIRCRSRRTWLVLSQVVLLPIFQLAIILAAHIDFHPRYFILSAPATLILTAAGWSMLFARRSFVPIIGVIRPIFVVGAAALAIATFARFQSVLWSSPIYQHDDFRAIAQRYAQLGPQDAIIIPYGWEPTLDYYSRTMAFQAKFIEIPLHSDTQTILDRLHTDLQGVQRAEVLTWYQLPADVRGAYPCLLRAVGQPLDSLTVNGLKTDAYRILPAGLESLQAAPQPAQVSYSPAGELRAQRLISARDAAVRCLITEWQITDRRDWRLAVRVYRDFGPMDNSADSVLLNDKQIPPSLWQAGQTVTAFTPLAPFDLPADQVRLIRAHLYTLDGSETRGALIGELYGAANSPAILRPVDWAALRHFDVPKIPAEARVAANFPGVGRLIGADMLPIVVRDSPPFVRLTWKAEGTPTTDYTVFIHLAAPDGTIIAQSDAQPVNGVRPTTTWAAGEYIQDGHVLNFNVRDYRGPADLFVGLYDAATGQRVQATDGRDRVRVRLNLDVR